MLLDECQLGDIRNFMLLCLRLVLDSFAAGAGTNCTACPPGTADADRRSSSPCTVCPAGKYSPGQTFSCSSCCDSPDPQLPDFDGSGGAADDLDAAEAAALAASLRDPSCVPGQTSDDDSDPTTPCCPIECSLGCTHDRCVCQISQS